ncbi:hypothetical protein [Streptacidiphilus monticola]|jgi:hypothetical protein|uniref:Uncharacterized protein n=1 Tax=Streptacidiphilus monticola TaxID=2161674 RepID=A0ABW1G6V3_9ACTN
MSAQPTEQPADLRVHAFPRTIDAVREAIPDSGERARFLEQVLAAPVDQVEQMVLARWYELMLAKVPGAEIRLADARQGINLVPLPEPKLVGEE